MDVVNLVRVASYASQLGTASRMVQSALNAANVVAITQTASSVLTGASSLAKYVNAAGQLDTASLARDGFVVKDGVIARASEGLNSDAIASAMRSQAITPVIGDTDVDIDAAFASFSTREPNASMPPRQAAAAEPKENE